jgi:hypothetical protein
MSEQQKPFKVETVVEAPAEVVWRSFTSPELIHQWFGWDYDGLEGEIRAIFVDDAKTDPQDHRIVFSDGQTISLLPEGKRTVVRVVMPGDLEDAKWDDIYDGIEEGWRTFFEQLRFYFERHQDSGLRKTLYLTGTGKSSAVLTLLDDAKEPWHESRYQRIVVGTDGLLRGIAAQQPIAEDTEGPVSLTITTYGLDDAAFAELEKQWNARWSEVTEPAS